MQLRMRVSAPLGNYACSTPDKGNLCSACMPVSSPAWAQPHMKRLGRRALYQCSHHYLQNLSALDAERMSSRSEAVLPVTLVV